VKSDDNAWFSHWRRSIVDVLVGASTVAVAFAAIGTMADLLRMLLILGACALVGIGLMLEPSVTAQPAGGINPQPSRADPEPILARPRPRAQAVVRFDAAIIDATRV
jgi:hypothetical protein